ncbi:MAG: hypothetical protein K9J17_13470 [Flavobacteriales bacterium]|nr:hypothetical protein [Flavobacteriales bacterium]
MSGVIGRTTEEVVSCVRDYAESKSGGLEQQVDNDLKENTCIIHEGENGTAVVYPMGFVEWDSCSQYISQQLNCPVFSFHIHDGDFWMYVLYNRGDQVDQFIPIPDYWDENVSEEEITAQKGNPQLLAELIPKLKAQDVSNYLVRWEWGKEPTKAYPNDTYNNEDWQLIDFMDKIRLAFPLNDQYKPIGSVYTLWTDQLLKAN